MFGLAQAPAYFQELMTGILKDFPFAIAYLDDIIIFSKTPQEHLSHICMVFEKLKSANLSMKKSKCSFFSKEIQYLGHILSATGIWPLPSKTHAIQHMNPPTTPKQVRAFLGLVGYYRKFIKDLCKNSKTTHPTHQTTSKVWLDSGTSRGLHTFERSHCSGTNPPLPQSKQNLHCIHRCFWWCLWSSALPRTRGNWVSSSILISYFFWNTVQMEYHRTGSLWSILCNYQMELLPTRSQYNCLEWPQTASMIPEWQECK